MRSLCLLLFTLLVVPGHAYVELLDYGSTTGPTHIDPINNRAAINFRRNGSGNVKVTANCPPTTTAADGSSQQKANYFFYLKTTLDEQGKVVDQKREGSYIKNGSCQSLEQKSTKTTQISDCKSIAALDVEVSEENPTQTSAVQNSFREIALLKQSDGQSQGVDLKAQAESCPGNINKNAFIVVHGTAKEGEPIASKIADLKNKSVCEPPEKRIDVPGADWEDKNVDSQLFAAKDGFYIGEKKYGNAKDNRHTKYFFDRRLNQWCINFAPRVEHPVSCNGDAVKKSDGSTGKLNILDNPLPMTFILKGDMKNPGETKVNKGAVTLKVENGVPTAYVSSLLPSYTSGKVKPEDIDKSKPVVKISVYSEPSQKTTFETFINNASKRKLTIDPSYVMSKTSPQPICDKSTCLMFHPDPNKQDQRLCSKNESPVDLNPAYGDNEQEICYSCNGISPGACGTDKLVIHNNSINNIETALKSCRNTSPINPARDQIPVNDEEPIVEQ